MVVRLLKRNRSTLSNVAPSIDVPFVPNVTNEGTEIDLSVLASDLGLDDTLTYEWDFGDGSAVANGSAVSHTYSDEGTGEYTVTLTVTDDSGAFDSETFTVMVSNVAPVLDSFTIPNVADVGDSVDFAASASDVGVNDVLTYEWNFGDGSTASGANASHTFTADGTYQVTLTVTDDSGDSVSTTQSITVSNGGNQGPIIDSLTGPTSGVAGETLTFDAEVTDPDGIATVTQTWTVIDSAGNVVASETGATFDYVPDTPGAYSVVFTAKDDDNNEVSSSVSLNVSQVGVGADGNLYVAGTDANDWIAVYGNSNGDLYVYLNDMFLGQYWIDGEIIVNSYDGHDGIYISKHITLDTQLYGGAGNDWIVGGKGDDYIDGGAGSDWAFGRRGEDTIYGNDGDDVLYGGKNDDFLSGDDGDDYLYGGDGNDILEGGEGDDVLFGGRGADMLLGQDGNDFLIGGSGRDALSGGDGNDILLGDRRDTFNGGAGYDWILVGWWC